MFDALRQSRPDAVIVSDQAENFTNAPLIAELSAMSRLPTIYLSVPKTRFGRIGDVVHREQDVTLGRQGAESDDAPARLC